MLLQVIEYAKTQSFIFTLTIRYIVLENAILAQKKLFFGKLGSSFEKGILEQQWTCLVFQGRDCPSCSWVCWKPRGKRAHLWFFEGRPHPAVATGHMLSGNGPAQMEEHVCRCIHSCDPQNVWKTRFSFFFSSIHPSYQNKNYFDKNYFDYFENWVFLVIINYINLLQSKVKTTLVHRY